MFSASINEDHTNKEKFWSSGETGLKLGGEGKPTNLLGKEEKLL